VPLGSPTQNSLAAATVVPENQTSVTSSSQNSALGAPPGASPNNATTVGSNPTTSLNKASNDSATTTQRNVGQAANSGSENGLSSSCDIEDFVLEDQSFSRYRAALAQVQETGNIDCGIDALIDMMSRVGVTENDQESVKKLIKTITKTRKLSNKLQSGTLASTWPIQQYYKNSQLIREIFLQHGCEFDRFVMMSKDAPSLKDIYVEARGGVEEGPGKGPGELWWQKMVVHAWKIDTPEIPAHLQEPYEDDAKREKQRKADLKKFFAERQDQAGENVIVVNPATKFPVRPLKLETRGTDSCTLYLRGMMLTAKKKKQKSYYCRCRHTVNNSLTDSFNKLGQLLYSEEVFNRFTKENSARKRRAAEDDGTKKQSKKRRTVKSDSDDDDDDEEEEEEEIDMQVDEQPGDEDDEQPGGKDDEKSGGKDKSGIGELLHSMEKEAPEMHYAGHFRDDSEHVSKAKNSLYTGRVQVFETYTFEGSIKYQRMGEAEGQIKYEAAEGVEKQASRSFKWPFGLFNLRFALKTVTQLACETSENDRNMPSHIFMVIGAEGIHYELLYGLRLKSPYFANLKTFSLLVPSKSDPERFSEDILKFVNHSGSDWVWKRTNKLVFSYKGDDTDKRMVL